MSQSQTTKAKSIAQKKAHESQSTSPQQTQEFPRLRPRLSPEAVAATAQQAKYSEARKYLATNGILEPSAPCTPSTLAKAIITIGTQFGLPVKVEKALTHLAEAAAKIDTQCTACEKLSSIPDMLDELRVELQTGLDDKLDRLGKTLEEKLKPIQANSPNTSEKLEDAAKNLSELAAGLEAKINKVTDTTSQLANTATTYRDALLNKTTSAPNQGGPNATNPAINAATDRKMRQVLVQLSEADVATLSQGVIMEKATSAIEQITDPPPPEGIAIKEVTKLRKGAILLMFNSKEAAEWIQNSEVELEFTIHFHPGATIKPRQFALLAPRTPLTFDPDNDNHLREIEETNLLGNNTIVKARWIKPANRRKAEQRVAHATFTLNDAKAANKCISEGILICGAKVYPSKLKQEPTQCMKCRKWGHFATDCMEAKDTCGTCGGDHRTNTCTETTKKYCASCNNHTHASWDRGCPEFAKRCAWYDSKHPDNLLKFFPTGEAWTQEVRPERIPLPERFPAQYAVGSLPPPNKKGKERERPTRQIERNRIRPRPKHKRPPGQPEISTYFTPSQRAPAHTEVEEGEVDIDNFLTPDNTGDYAGPAYNDDPSSGWN
jgi:hypothetical protein